MKPVPHVQHVMAVACIVALSALPICAFSQAFPSKPVKMLTQFGQGAPGDILARVVANQMAGIMGQPVVVESRTGGAGILAASALVRAAPDGYTILALSAGVPVVGVVLSRNRPPFDPEKDLTPITPIGEVSTLIVAHPSAPGNSLKGLIDYAKRNPGKLSYGTTGIGSPHHLSAEEIRMLTGADLVHVPYKTAPIVDAASGAIPIAYAIVAQAMPFIKQGKVKVLAVVSDSRSRVLPDVPIVSEIVPGFEPPPNWMGLFGPANLPQAVLRRLHADAVKAITSPEGRAKILDIGFEPMASKSPEEFAALIQREIELVERIVKATGIPQID